MATDGGISSLGALLHDVVLFEVPDFQRNYSWEAENVDALYQDLRYAAKNDSTHFLGSTILMKKSPNDAKDRTFQVIDGQQRLTTIFLLIAIMRDLINELPDQQLPSENPHGTPTYVIASATNLLFSNASEGKPRFSSNYMLRNFMNTYVFRHPSPDRPALPKKDKSTTLALRKAAWRLRKALEDDLKEIEANIDKLKYLNNLLETLSKRFTILKIETTDQTESFDIFMTLNNRGLALGPSDLVKSLIMKYLTTGLSGDDLSNKNSDITGKWSEATDYIDDGDMNQFLRHFLLAQQIEGVRGKDIFAKIDRMIAEDPSGPSIASQKMLEQIVRKASIYSSLLKPLTMEDEHLRGSCVVMQQVLDSYRIFMLNVVDPQQNLEQSQQRDLTRLCEVLSLRWVLTGGNAQKLEDHFQVCSSYFRESPFNYEELKEQLVSIMPSDTLVENQFAAEIESSSFVRMVLFKINAKINDESGLLAYNSKNIHVEHIAPESATKQWIEVLFPGQDTKSVGAEYSVLVEQWGNKTLLDKHINLQIKQKPFKEKRDGDSSGIWKGYTNSNVQLTKDLIKVPDWSVAEVKLRNDWIADSFLKIWAVDPRDSELKNYSEYRKT